MNNKRIGKFAVTAIVGVLSAVSGIVGVEMMKSVKKDIEKTYNRLGSKGGSYESIDLKRKSKEQRQYHDRY